MADGKKGPLTAEEYAELKSLYMRLLQHHLSNLAPVEVSAVKMAFASLAIHPDFDGTSKAPSDDKG
jgi:hypothetical protein